MARPSKFPAELRDRAVRTVIESRDQYEHEWKAITKNRRPARCERRDSAQVGAASRSGYGRRNRRDELLGLVPGDASSATWTLACDVVSSATEVDLKGPYIQGPPGGRFIYLSWGTVDDAEQFTLFRRAKLWLDGIPPDVVDRAADGGLVIGRLGLADRKGHPLCAAVRPPLIEWSATAAD